MTHIEQILGLRCMYKERQPLDKCRECTGYRCFAKSIECFEYIPKLNNYKIRMPMCMKTQDIVDKIRRANDGGAI